MAIYEGEKNYIFVSYAHKDAEIVLPIVDALIAGGFRVWYDQGIEAGTEWPAYIEEHLLGCERMLAFLSPNSVESINCRNEINLAATENKEMLVVYLEETKLKHGLGLQLGAKQSLFRYRHEEDKTFLEELLKAKLLQCCREGSEEDTKADISSIKIPKRTPKPVAVEDTGDYITTKQSRIGGPSAISRVSTIGSNTPQNAWPQGTYSQNINVRRNTTVHFHCHLLRAQTEAAARTVGLRIFDGNDVLVHENITKIQFVPGNDRFSLPWIIREANGFAQAPGTYTALIWIDDSKVIEYPFRITSGEEQRSEAPKLSSVSRTAVEREINDVKKNLAYPKVALFQFLTYVCFALLISSASSMSSESEIVIIGALIAMLVFSIQIYIGLGKALTKNGFLRFLLVYIVGIYFGIFLVIKGIICLFSMGRNKRRLKELESQL